MQKIGKFILILLLLGSICHAKTNSDAEVINIADFSHGGMHLHYYFNHVLNDPTVPMPEDVKINIIAPDEAFKLQPGMLMAIDLPDFPVPANAETFTIGRMPVVAAVAANNPLNDLTVDQLRMIYTGRIQLWKDLKIAHPGLIIRTGPADHSPHGRIFRFRVMGQDLNSSATPPPGRDILPGVRIISQRNTAETMARLQDGIIIIGGWELANSPHLKILKINGIKPTKDTISKGQYPLFTDHKLIVPRTSKNAPAIKQIFQFFRISALKSGNML